MKEPVLQLMHFLKNVNVPEYMDAEASAHYESNKYQDAVATYDPKVTEYMDFYSSFLPEVSEYH